MAINAVIFDIGNVLIEWQPERYYDQIIGEERRRAMFAEVDLHGMNDLVDQGHHFTDTIYDWAEKYPEWRDEIRMWHDKWIELASPEIPQSVRLQKALRKRSIPVYALTNFGVQNFDYATTVYPFLNEFDRLYVSGRMQMVKPHAPIYEAVERDCGLDPATLLFADDRIDNINAAQARGWQTHLFDGPQGWAERLVAEGLLTESEAV
ncbi:?-D-glucose-1-phosphatase [Falsiruegeria litorea R37]|uniref:?-D-glucose-1-phosphatase n=1 Tax=Falsiruegeria litorea R37 TaxID=1200284 RepID=A0A1Y5TIN0_9RHOB|nr:HAD family phosphatase [Falsiruegeria litorea]SLN62829.1 ?-D-glucose-1-phosphatase [Falsiruegeria litorea R37]